MTFASDLLPAIGTIRSIPGAMGIRPYRVYIRSGAWSGTYTGDKSVTVTETEVTEHGHPPKVRFVADEEVALGSVARGSCTIGPITPSHSGGGTAIALLEGSSLVVGQTLHARLVHSDGSETRFRVTDVNKERALHYTMTCEPVSDA